jgi:hypothetical protein
MDAFNLRSSNGTFLRYLPKETFAIFIMHLLYKKVFIMIFENNT